MLARFIFDFFCGVFWLDFFALTLPLTLKNQELYNHNISPDLTCARHCFLNLLFDLKESVAEVVFVYESRTRSVLSTHSEGLLSQQKFQECLTATQAAVDKIFQFYRVVIQKKFSKGV